MMRAGFGPLHLLSGHLSGVALPAGTVYHPLNQHAITQIHLVLCM